ncbi:hypothetical protein Rsub_07707 [Raphidocelis subcapitata]|uniref:RWD domain-containing protein n=1 Tax=Raphidocelis subcapitata TaxID=307507 RepID=A0A2V0PB49_9CHLO|nr:hypothetical protein Rsub_07707 [Raphidocelis subcapitata]|eukprot:GBF95123.1 hypothetical protein Rsub_07707 [Raphidocelis subcapitata]
MADAAAAEDAEQRAEEFASLEAIYGGDIDLQHDMGVAELHIPGRAAASPHAVARATCPAGYPSASAPVAELSGPQLPPGLAAEAAAQLEALFVPGEVVLFSWFEWVRDRLEAWLEGERRQREAREALAAVRLAGGGDGGSEGDGSGSGSGGEEEEEQGAEVASLAAAQQRGLRAPAADGDAALMASVAPRIVSGPPHTERRSTFQAHCCRVTEAREVGAVVAVLLQSSKIAGATHPAIMAYRIAVGPGVYAQDCDDDGEAAAGGRLLHLLQLARAENVVVVVSRWFGGVLLGPSRFALINNVARALLVEQGFIAGGGGGGEGGGKKKKGRGR